LVQRRFEELAYHTVRKVALELARTGTEDSQALRLGQTAGGTQERRLADARRPGQEQGTAFAGNGFPQRPA
jgi:hypothetical protein